jgi:uncharacterized membrane-anchored protein
MTAFARQLRGQFEILQNARGGITARLVFPAPGEHARAGDTAPDAPSAPPKGNQAAA